MKSTTLTPMQQFKEQVAVLQGQNNTLRSRLEEAKTLAESRGKDIALFKAEVLQLTTEKAEMAGYIKRTLEDDAVREIGAVKPPEGMSERERSDRHKQIEDEARAARPPRSVRTGPCASPIYNGDGFAMSAAEAFDTYSPHDRYTKLVPTPKHWLDR